MTWAWVYLRAIQRQRQLFRFLCGFLHRWFRRQARALLLLSCSFFMLPLQANSLTGTAVHIQDGDTLQVLSGQKKYTVRLLAIDAPEQDQAFGSASKKNLSALTLGQFVTVDWQKRDSYGRIIGQVFIQPADCKTAACPFTLDINHQQVQSGSAWWYRHYASEQRPTDAKLYEQAENQARHQRSGLWSQPNPLAPWSWRRSQRR